MRSVLAGAAWWMTALSDNDGVDVDVQLETEVIVVDPQCLCSVSCFRSVLCVHLSVCD